MNNLQKLKMIFVSVSLLACSLIANIAPAATAMPSAILLNTPEATSTPKTTATPFYSVEIGKMISVKSGGFSVWSIKGYKIWREDNVGVHLISSDKQVELGVLAYPRPGGSTLVGLMSNWREGFKNDFDEVNFADAIEETKDEINSISIEFIGVDKKIPLQGRLIIYAPKKAKMIYLYTIAYGDQRWQREGQKTFETTAKSIKLFAIQALENCPTAKDQNYGYLKTKPIKIGGGEEEGSIRIDNYLGALLGRKGEIVSYNFGKADSYAGVDLNVYLLRIGNDIKQIYFDTSNYEDLHVPYGLSCSAPLPGKPIGEPSL